MSIYIDEKKCIGCGRCHEVCPGTLIKLNENKKAYIKYPKDCWGCTSCLKECPANAIRFYLGADIGGKGSLVHTEKSEGLVHWIVERPDGTTTTIDINPKESNKY
ncbi:ferredoxin family protein [Fibrobacter sp. UWEL]|uniref:4Fe-4S dicluster domain-containing protein n=1 Tax=Fibrobacter sp. UWEL TaxID=1896209 RepID=UPI0009175779|nr:ferredoxin family protein [Fibrobacter sp. UWEL]SHK82730.1 dissimilatory adenylylsulfate reductase beta subunit [Fibrobacter sp. UWEL]